MPLCVGKVPEVKLRKPRIEFLTILQDHSIPFRFLGNNPRPVEVSVPTTFEDSEEDDTFSDWMKDMEQKVMELKSELNAVAVTFLSNPNKL